MIFTKKTSNITIIIIKYITHNTSYPSPCVQGRDNLPSFNVHVISKKATIMLKSFGIV